MNNSDRNRLALMLLNDGSGSLSRRSAVSNAFESAVGVDPTQAEFLRSEKDTRPYWETDHRATVMPLAMSGYNNSVGYGVPTMLGGAMWTTLNDILSGRQTSPEERRVAAIDGSAMALLTSPFSMAPAGALRAGAMRTEPTPARSLDPLGYYSRALEEAKTLPAKASPDQVLATLKNKGVKPGEIEATGLAEFLQGKPSVTRDNVVGHLTDNRVRLNEVRRGDPFDNVSVEQSRGSNPVWQIIEMQPEYRGGPLRRRVVASGYASEAEARGDVPAVVRQSGVESTAKWSQHSLDPSNPTYRETVLHLPESDGGFGSGHFPEPNIVGHMMTSVNRHEGKPVFTLDQIQSDWGQKLRDGGVRDDAKIAGLKQRVEEANKRYITLMDERDTPFVNPDGSRRNWNSEWTPAHAEQAKGLAAAKREYDLLKAELKTAEASSPGHPLVNTTDQWTNTTLRRALQQAIEQDAKHIAVPRGDTVLSYNPGNTHGMNTFYNEIVPKNLAKILGGLDRNGVSRTIVDQLQTPSGMKGNGFTVFDITPEMRQAAIKGMPLFANHPAASLAALLAHADRDQP